MRHCRGKYIKYAKGMEGRIKMKKRILAALLIATLIMSSFTVFAAGETAEPGEIYGSYYRLVNKATGNVIAAEGGNTENLALIVTEKNDPGNKNQVYRVTKVDEKYVYLMNMISRRSLDVPDALKTAGTQLIQYTYYSNIQQKMELTLHSDGYYTISPAHCDLVLAEKDGKVIQSADSKSDYSRWKLEFVSGPVLNSVVESPGYKLLSDNRQSAVKRYFFSDLWISQQAANNAESLFAAADYASLSAEKQAALLEQALSWTASYQVGGTLPYDSVAEYKIVSKSYDPSFDIWRGDRRPCWIYEVEMAGDAPGQLHKFTFVSNEEDVPMVERSIEALGRLPYAIRQYVHNLYWKAGDGANSFNGGGNQIWIRLNYVPETSMQIAGTLCHELGHILDSNTLPNNDVWSYAESLDGCPISGYGASNQAEDLAEFNKLYIMSRGTDLLDDVEKTYPNRYAVLSGMLYRADPVYFADLAPYEAKITEIENILAHRADGSIAKKIDDKKYYILRDKKTGKVATVKDASLDNETPLVLEDFKGADNQLFFIEKYGDTIRFFVKHSGSSIQLDDSGIANMTVNQYGGTWAVDDRFAVYEQNGAYIFKSVRYDLALSNDGEYVRQNKNAAEWLLEAYSSNKSNYDYTISVGNLRIAATDDGVVGLKQSREAEKSNYLWKLKNLHDNVYRIVNSKTGEAIDILDLSTKPGAKAITWNVTGEENQMFVMEETPSGAMFKCVHSGLYLTLNTDFTISQQPKADYRIQAFKVERVK